MSGFSLIEDGQGLGYRAGVNENNRLKVSASIFSEEHGSSVKGDAYFANTADTADTLTLASGNTYNMLYLRNDGNAQRVVIEKILVSAAATGLVMKWTRNPVLGSIGANNTHTPPNVNFGSNRSAVGTFYSWDETGTDGLTGLSGGTTVKTFIVGAGFNVFPIDGAIILGQSNSILISLTNGTGSAIEAECGVRFYYEDLDL